MNIIKTGLLDEVYPLNAKQIAELETLAAETGEVFLYANQSGDVCIAAPFNAEDLDGIAWHQLHKFTIDDTSITKTIHDRLSAVDWEIVDILQKEASGDSDSWISIYVVSNKLDTFKLGKSRLG